MVQVKVSEFDSLNASFKKLSKKMTKENSESFRQQVMQSVNLGAKNGKMGANKNLALYQLVTLAGRFGVDAHY